MISSKIEYMKVSELKKYCKENGIKGISDLKKKDIIREPQGWYNNIFKNTINNNINKNMWPILIDWLAEVNIKFKFNQSKIQLDKFLKKYMYEV